MAVFHAKMRAVYFFHCASKSVQTQFLYGHVLGLYKSKVRLVYDALFQRYKAIKNTYRFAFFFFFFRACKKNRETVLIYIFGTMHHLLNELWICIDPGPVYTKTEFGLILMHSGKDTGL